MRLVERDNVMATSYLKHILEALLAFESQCFSLLKTKVVDIVTPRYPDISKLLGEKKLALMQGQRNSMSTVPENLSFDRGFTATDTSIDPQMSWNSIHNVSYLRDPNVSYLRDGRHEGQSGEWGVGQTSASAAQNQGEQNQRKTDHAWSVLSRATHTLEEPQHRPSNDFSTDVVRMDSNENNAPDGFILLNNLSSGTLTRDLNMSPEYGEHEDDDCQIIEHPNTYISIGSSSEQRVSTGGSSDSFGVPSGRGGYATRDTETRAVSLDGRRISGKRKLFEVTGQSSGAGSSSFNPHAERSQWHYMPTNPISASNSTISAQAENEVVNNDRSQPSYPTFRIGVGEAVSASPFSLTAPGTPGSSHRHFRLRVNGSHQQDPMPGSPYPTDASVGNFDVSSSRRSSRLVLRNRFLDLNPAPEADIGSARGQSDLLHVPSVRLNPQPLLNGASSSRTSRSHASALPGQRDAVLYEEPMQRHIPRNISEHPVFLPASERRSSQHPTNWNFAIGNNSTAGNVSSTSLVGSSSRVNSAAPSWAQRSYPQYSRRLSELVRRSLISSTGTDSGGPTSNPAAQPGSSSMSQENAFTENHMSNSRSTFFERHVDGAFGLPYPLRNLASSSEGRGAVMSEIRRVLDLMRRGEGLRLEDVMLLDHSVFFGMADIHDRHRDMRLDVDNMSYEELLALEERIGNVCTGLTEENISSLLKTRRHVDIRAENSVETEPCSICREEYNEGEGIGTLECGHDFHQECIKQWLMQKNLCPICKTTGLTTK
ncbi:probable E3 ubiquitin-protein ligase RHG1A isoform X2 [Henckelia pumila]|uniref:probable E3 ubiquitin-protein ligase RHG1A isoform X2 n=1 Tax=Henckelia pumila TaxID=405737 RepID=UPI003C6E0485